VYLHKKRFCFLALQANPEEQLYCKGIVKVLAGCEDGVRFLLKRKKLHSDLLKKVKLQSDNFEASSIIDLSVILLDLQTIDY